MITLTAQIELLKSGTGNGDNGILSGVSLSPSTLSGNNASAEIGAVLGSKKTIKKPFVFGKSFLGGGDKYYGELDYFMGGQLSNDNGNFANEYTLYLRGYEIKSITIAFDDLNNAFPKSIVVNKDTASETTITDDDPLWTTRLPAPIINNTGNQYYTLTISNWNKPNSPLIISGIYIDLTIEIDRKNVQSLECSIFDRADISMPSFGIISNTGNIAFNDVDGEVRDYAEQQILKSGLNVTISLNNTLTKASQTVAVLKTADWDYDSYNRAVTVSLKDDLEEWQEINIAEIYFDLKSQQSKTLKYFYEYLHERTPSQYNMLSFNELDSKTQDILQNTTIRYPYLEKGTLWQQWSKLCEVAQLHIYKENNRTICVYNEGN